MVMGGDDDSRSELSKHDLDGGVIALAAVLRSNCRRGLGTLSTVGQDHCKSRFTPDRVSATSDLEKHETTP